MLLVGPTGVGKTSLLGTVDLEQTLFLDVEAGDLAIQDLAVDTLRPRTWQECRDIAVALAGVNPAVPESACYSATHLDAVRKRYSDQDLSRYRTIFVNSITAAGRLSFAWSSQQPEALRSDRQARSARRVRRARREMHAWLMHLQQARAVNVIFVGILETVADDFNRTEHRLQLEGSRTGRELPAIVDEVVTYNWIDFGDGVLTRSFVCTTPNPWNYPAKDRSGRLEQIEEPHLGKLITKLAKPGSAASISIPSADQKASK